MTSLHIRQKKSAIGEKISQRGTLSALGLRRNGQAVTHEDSPTLRGMLRKIAHLVDVNKSER